MRRIWQGEDKTPPRNRILIHLIDSFLKLPHLLLFLFDFVFTFSNTHSECSHCPQLTNFHNWLISIPFQTFINLHYKYWPYLLLSTSMLRSSSSSIFSLLRQISIPVSFASIVSYNQLSFISKPTQFRSSFNFATLSSGYFNQSPFSQSFRSQQTMASDSSAQPKSVHEFVVKVGYNPLLITQFCNLIVTSVHFIVKSSNLAVIYFVFFIFYILIVLDLMDGFQLDFFG